MLGRCLTHLSRVKVPSEIELEVILVNNNSADQTKEVMVKFAEGSSYRTKIIDAQKVGLGYARNCGIEKSSGEMLVFTDDDCYLDQDYFINFLSICDLDRFQFGMGPILLANTDDDPRVASLNIKKELIIPPKTAVIPAGYIQGANMFFLKEIFGRAGLFNKDMGPGTPFICEDIEMACRASHAGYTGALLPGFTVYHAHGRKTNSAEALRTIYGYDQGRGAYYSSLIARGVPEAWAFWQATFTRDRNINVKVLSRFSRELEGASKYLAHLASRKDREP